MSDPSYGFPSTHWSRMAPLHGKVTADHRGVINWLIERYWKPVYVYFRRKGFDPDMATELAQDFFVQALTRELFERADQARGRFRVFLLSCLKRFLIDRHRRRKTREKIDGVVSIQDLVSENGGVYEPQTDETPEDAFHRTWVNELLQRVWKEVQIEMRNSGQQVHAELFRQRVYEPAMTGEKSPPLKDLAAQYGLKTKEASNRIVTVIRAFRRRLTAEIQQYASTEEEVQSELRDLLRFAADPDNS